MRIDILFPDREETLVLTPEKAKLRLTEILRGANLPLNTRCGERDMCAGCTIVLVSGSLRHVDDGSVLRADAPAGEALRRYGITALARSDAEALVDRSEEHTS